MRWIWLVGLAVMALGVAGCVPKMAPPKPQVDLWQWQQLDLELVALTQEVQAIASEISDWLQPFSIKRDMQASGSALSEALGAVKRRNAQKLLEWLLEARARLMASIEELSQQDRRWFDLEALYERAKAALGRLDGLLKRVPL